MNLVGTKYKPINKEGINMTKKLEIRFVKFERALAMQILEQEGYFDTMKHVSVSAYPAVDETRVFLRGWEKEYDYSIKTIRFNNNVARDEYLNNVIKWISEEQFAENGKLEVGKLCDVSDDNKDWRRRTLLAVLPKSYFSKYIASENYSDFKWCSWKYARPLASCVQPKIDGDVYTWEKEVADER